MIRYILKRLVTMIFIIVGVAFVVFSIMEMTPGDPAVMMLGDNASAESIQAFREQNRLDDPFLLRFANYVVNLFTKLDFGTSWLTSRPILETLQQRIPITLIIAISSIAFASVIGVLLGVISAVKQYSVLDYVARVTAMVMATSFLAGYDARNCFCSKTRMAACQWSRKLEKLCTANDDSWNSIFCAHSKKYKIIHAGSRETGFRPYSQI